MVRYAAMLALSGCVVQLDDSSPHDGADTAPEPGVPVSITAGERHTCALMEAGDVVCWGANDDGQLDAPDGVIYDFIVAGTKGNCGIQTDGVLSCWGQLSNLQPPAPFPDAPWVLVAMGTNVACAVSQDGRPACWGASAPDLGGARATDLDASGTSICFVQGNTDLRCEGGSEVGAHQAASVTDLVDVDIDAVWGCGIHADDTVSCWGWTPEGYAPPFEQASAISVGGNNACMVSLEGDLSCDGPLLGSADFPIRGIAEVAVGTTHACILTLDNRIQCAGSNQSGQLDVPQVFALTRE